MKQATLVYTLASPALVKSEYTVASSVESNDVFDGYVSFSIEFSSFPDFAGNNSHPNTFSDNLLNNIRDIIGTKPYIRVGGNTQDYALYDASLPFALNGTVDPARSPDYPTTITIGPSYFESYNTWPDVKFCHGFNLGLGANSSAGWQTLLDTVPLACKALSDEKLYIWAYGNEPDLYSTAAQGPVRPADWDEETYVSQWLNGTRQIQALLEEHCPELADQDRYGFIAPEFGGVANRLQAPETWAAGLNSDNNVNLFSTHNYISGAESPGVTLQGTLMNHAVTKRSVDAHVVQYNEILATSSGPVPPHVLGETNSLYNQGRPGLSNTFGAALWVADFNLYAAAVGLKRVHMHMGTNYRYGAWQPISTDLDPIGTKAPYYGSIAVAAALSKEPATVVEIPLESQTSGEDLQPEAAYAIYTSGGTRLSRLIILNLRSYNTTVSGAGLEPLPNPPPRNGVEYVFRLPATTTTDGTTTETTTTETTLCSTIPLLRLLANGSDAITGVTWDGWSYNYELDGGKPVRLGNVTVGEVVEVEEGGMVTVLVPDASAVLLDLEGCYGVGEGEGGDGKEEVESDGGKWKRGWGSGWWFW